MGVQVCGQRHREVSVLFSLHAVILTPLLEKGYEKREVKQDGRMYRPEGNCRLSHPLVLLWRAASPRSNRQSDYGTSRIWSVLFTSTLCLFFKPGNSTEGIPWVPFLCDFLPFAPRPGIAYADGSVLTLLQRGLVAKHAVGPQYMWRIRLQAV